MTPTKEELQEYDQLSKHKTKLLNRNAYLVEVLREIKLTSRGLQQLKTKLETDIGRDLDTAEKNLLLRGKEPNALK